MSRKLSVVIVHAEPLTVLSGLSLSCQFLCLCTESRARHYQHAIAGTFCILVTSPAAAACYCEGSYIAKYKRLISNVNFAKQSLDDRNH